MRRMLFAAMAVMAFGGDAFAWGDVGHTVVCEIAFRLAAPETRAEIRQLIQTDSRYDFFSESCTWPDHPHKRAPEHFINLPRDSRGLTSDTCPIADKCTLTAIASDFAVLSSRSRDANKLEQLGRAGRGMRKAGRIAVVEQRVKRG